VARLQQVVSRCAQGTIDTGPQQNGWVAAVVLLLVVVVCAALFFPAGGIARRPIQANTGGVLSFVFYSLSFV
jgi:hypothetical protein